MLICVRVAIFTAIRILLSLLDYKTTVCFAEIGWVNTQCISEDEGNVLCSSEASVPIYQIPRNHKPEEPSNSSLLTLVHFQRGVHVMMDVLWLQNLI